MAGVEQVGSPHYPYPSRPGGDISEALEKLKAEPEVELNAEQREVVQNFERELTKGPDGLEAAWQLKINSTVFYPEYFQTDKGRAEFYEVIGREMAADKTDFEDVAAQLYETDYSVVESKKLASLANSSRSYADARVLEQFAASNYESVEDVDNPARLTVVRNPDVLAEQIAKYRALKDKHRELGLNLDKGEGAVVEAEKVMLTIHRRRLNQLIAETYPMAANLVRQEKIVDDGSYNDSLKQIDENMRGMGLMTGDQAAKSLGRLDKFRRGVGAKDSAGKYSQVRVELLKVAEKLIEESGSSERDECVFSDVDEETLAATNVTAQEWSEWAREALDHYGLLSDQAKFDFGRAGRAKDGKWQVVIDPNRRSIDVEGRRGVVLVPKKFDRPVVQRGGASGGAAGVLDHEIAHVIQNENGAKLGLAIMERVGMDRSNVLFEGGAVEWEAAAQDRLFGIKRPVNTAYLKAIQTKLAGGSYKQCMQSYFDETRMRNPKIDIERAAKVAIGSTTRLFRRGGSFSDTSHHLTDSSSLVYLEQERVARQLEKAGQADLMMIGWTNIEMLAELKRVDMLNTDAMKIPDKRPTEIVEERIRSKIKEVQE